MSELVTGMILALQDAHDAATRIQDELAPSVGDEAEKAVEVSIELGLVRNEVVTTSKISKQQAGDIVVRIHKVITKCTGRLQQLHPLLMKAIEATLRAAAIIDPDPSAAARCCRSV